jgi:hypothetical protein
MEYRNNTDIVTREDIYSNPDNLNFYLAVGDLNSKNFEIIKKENFISDFGEIELAIIGSSHYFSLKDNFIEILTCSDEKYSDNQLIFSEEKKKNFRFEHRFPAFIYKFSAETKQFSKHEDFLTFEKTLLEKRKGFFHAFCDNSAITSINYINSKNNFLLETYHTYPEYSKIISSETQLIIAI